MCSVHGRGRNLNKAVEVFNMAQSMGVALDEKAYTNMICYYGKAGNVLLFHAIILNYRISIKLGVLSCFTCPARVI